MIGYVTVGVSNMDKAKAFYSELLADLGAKVLMDMGRIAFIGSTMDAPMLSVCIPYDENDPSPGNGNMIAINPGSKEKVDALYLKAIALGASSEGEPGQRVPDVFYGAYIRDPDGNKIAFYEFG
ncbi:MAG: putative lactoylglutathione lyase [Candidatus Accumulibacter regalis]|jgi:predicted lactoylglutathione lyase|uniref:Lactoylglutathione lyase n=1 Tax=Accumulibacter regalis TaxID=522306 RepID=A0A011P741_ACCRE|nr:MULTISPECIES: VOC family protein [unclassified Candidatus Accumulibacter]EXI90788.1 MAG: putative lactoylglutathione lyase [Candidatus Accumulibacter regalis]MQM35808.1 VOC family protein [Candidatus Accumulibacter phosphatis]MBL8366580.1 VOC family protein [Accumulibacter sp.]MBN8514418.1 VOC family protein [Accumulibacter sp.]MBO3701039.1 VOC family protein [Accumulibacter sp.]